MPTTTPFSSHLSEARAAIAEEDWPKARAALLAGAQIDPLSDELHALMVVAFPSLPEAAGREPPEWLESPEATWRALHLEAYPRECLLDLLPEIGRVDEALFPGPELPAWEWMEGAVERDSGTAIDCDRGLGKWVPFDAPGHDGHRSSTGPLVRLERGVLSVLQTSAADERGGSGDEVWYFTAYRIRDPLLHGRWLRYRPGKKGAVRRGAEPAPVADPVARPLGEEAGQDGGTVCLTLEARGHVLFAAETPCARGAVASLLQELGGIVASRPTLDRERIEEGLVERGVPREEARAIAESARLDDESYFVVRKP
jgi:hypothetical protein